jgi:hypothetical protein
MQKAFPEEEDALLTVCRGVDMGSRSNSLGGGVLTTPTTVNTSVNEVPMRERFGEPGSSKQTHLPSVSSIGQDGNRNSKKFFSVFSPGAGDKSSTKNRISKDKVGSPLDQVQPAPVEPKAGELIPKVETLVEAFIDKINTATETNWGALAEQHKDLPPEFESLRKDLARIDKRAIAELHRIRIRTVYEKIEDAKKPDSKAGAMARALTKGQQDKILKETTSFQKRLLSKGNPENLNGAARALYNLAVEQQRAANEQSAIHHTIDSFKGRLSKEVEPAREKNIQNTCLKHLVADFENNGPGTPLYKLVELISPAAIKQFGEYEKNDEVEKFTKESIAACNSAAMIDSVTEASDPVTGDKVGHLTYTVGGTVTHTSYRGECVKLIADLRADLAIIDEKLVNDIRGLQATAYKDIWKSNQPAAKTLTIAQLKNIKEETSWSPKELALWNAKTLKDDRKKRREELKEETKKENADAAFQAAIDGFKNQVKDLLKPGRESEIKAACLEQLSKDPTPSHVAKSPLYRLVQQISPLAIKAFDDMPKGTVLRTTKTSTWKTLQKNAAKFVGELDGEEKELEAVRRFIAGAPLSEFTFDTETDQISWGQSEKKDKTGE